ncbi:metallophosphoesterase [Limibacter armeniacum]|uniref:metallophosphoesterase n=1 Tax=Limibacter armeniacum TaxID=466084 RepID=UPI002FE51130
MKVSQYILAGVALGSLLMGSACKREVSSQSDIQLTRQPYIQYKNEDSVRVRWMTDQQMKTPVMQWGEEKIEAYKVEHRLGNLYEAIVPTADGQLVSYGIFDGKEKISGDLKTNLLKNTGKSIQFFAVGDIGEATENGGFPTMLNKELSKFDGLQFGFLLGDIVYPVGASEKYDEQLFTPLAESLSKMPVFPILGNHDYGSDLDQNYFQEWAKVGNGHYYHIAKGNTQFLCLDSRNGSEGFYEFEEQKAWVEKTLKENQGKYKWTIIALHHPGKTCTYKKVSKQLISMYPIFNQYDVDLVMNGHAHTYERLNPMDAEGIPIQLENASQINDPLKDHFIAMTLGAGGKLKEGWTPEEKPCKFEGLVTKQIHAGHVGIFEINGDTLTFNLATHGTDDKDAFIWVKEAITQ